MNKNISHNKMEPESHQEILYTALLASLFMSRLWGKAMNAHLGQKGFTYWPEEDVVALNAHLGQKGLTY